MSQVTGGELVVRGLKAEGVQHIFSLSGGSIVPIYNACAEHGIRVLITRNEQSAAYMADAWGKLTGRPGVCVVTTGPAVLNALSGVATAYFADNPMLLISGHTDYATFDLGAMQEMDQIAATRPMVKWSRMVTDRRRIPEYVASAYRQALTGRPGPVHLDLPGDVLDGTCDAAEVSTVAHERSRTASGVRGDPAMIRKAVGLLHQAERPVILAGRGVAWSHGEPALRRFAELTHIPYFSKEDDLGCVSHPHALYAGLGTTRVNPVARRIGLADVVLALGMRVDFRSGFGRPPFFGADARVIRVDEVAEEIGDRLPVDVGIVADCRSALFDLIAEAQRLDWPRPSWIAGLDDAEREVRDLWEKAARSDRRPVHPLRLCREVFEFMNERDVIVSDGGDVGQWAKVAAHPRHPRNWLTVGPILGIGNGIPYAMAAKLARPDARVALISGDGSFGFAGMEYDVAVKEKIPFVAVVSTDLYWGIIRHAQIRDYGPDRAFGTDLGMTRYDRVAEALGGYGEFVEDPREIRPALQRAFDSGVPACINVPTEFTNPYLAENYGVRW